MTDGMMNDGELNNYLSDMMQGRDVETASGLLDDASQGLREALALAEAAGLKPEGIKEARGTWFRASVTPFSLGVEPSTGRDVRIMFYNSADAEHETAAAIRACVASHIQYGH